MLNYISVLEKKGYLLKEVTENENIFLIHIESIINQENVLSEIKLEINEFLDITSFHKDLFDCWRDVKTFQRLLRNDFTKEELSDIEINNYEIYYFDETSKKYQLSF